MRYHVNPAVVLFSPSPLTSGPAWLHIRNTLQRAFKASEFLRPLQSVEGAYHFVEKRGFIFKWGEQERWYGMDGLDRDISSLTARRAHREWAALVLTQTSLIHVDSPFDSFLLIFGNCLYLSFSQRDPPPVFLRFLSLCLYRTQVH